MGEVTGLPVYVPGPVEVGWEIWLGAAAGVIPFAIGAYEFGKRIVRFQTYVLHTLLHFLGLLRMRAASQTKLSIPCM